MLLTQRHPPNLNIIATFTLALTAEERTKSRHRWESEDGEAVFLHLPRGTVLRDGDILQDESGSCFVKIVAKPELVLTVTAQTELDIIKAAYHLGNRHVPLEITTTYLRLSPDPVLQAMLEKLGLKVKEEILPFQPETGAYGHQHS